MLDYRSSKCPIFHDMLISVFWTESSCSYNFTMLYILHTAVHNLPFIILNRRFFLYFSVYLFSIIGHFLVVYILACLWIYFLTFSWFHPGIQIFLFPLGLEIMLMPSPRYLVPASGAEEIFLTNFLHFLQEYTWYTVSAFSVSQTVLEWGVRIIDWACTWETEPPSAPALMNVMLMWFCSLNFKSFVCWNATICLDQKTVLDQV